MGALNCKIAMSSACMTPTAHPQKDDLRSVDLWTRPLTIFNNYKYGDTTRSLRLNDSLDYRSEIVAHYVDLI